MSTDVLGYLQSKGINFKQASAHEINTHCWFCDEPPDKRGRLYVNVDPNADIPGLFDCKRCGVHGALPTIMKHFGDSTGPQVNDDTSEMRRVLTIAAHYYMQRLANDGDEALDYLMGPKRMLTMQTIVDRKLGYAPAYKTLDLYGHLRDCGFESSMILGSGLVRKNKYDKLEDTFRGMITIPYLMHRDAVDIRGRAYPYDAVADKSLPKYRTLSGKDARLFNTDTTWKNVELTICEGEFDAMIVEQMGFPAVGVPGANTWQDSWDGYLEDARRLFLAFDPDDAGKKGAKKLNERFGHKIRELPSLGGDVTEWYAAGNQPSDYQALLDAVGLGKYLKTVADAREEWNGVQGKQGVKLGIEQLDHVIEPGLLPGQVAVAIAKSGTGKTLFCLNLMQRIRMVPGQEDTDFLFVSLEQTTGEWWDRARKIWRFYNTDGDDDACDAWWNEHILLVDKNRLSPGEFKQVLADYEIARGKIPAVTFVDYLGYYAQGFPGDRYSRTSDAIMSLKEVAKEARTIIVTPHQVSREAKYGEEPDVDAARDAGVVEETADFMFVLWTPDATLGREEEEKSGLLNLRLGKSRHGGRNTKIAFQFAPISLTMVPHGEPKYAAMARHELVFEKAHEKFEDVARRHKLGLVGSLDEGIQQGFDDTEYGDGF